MSNVKLAGQETSLLGPNTVPGVSGKAGAPSMPATARSNDGNRFVQLLEQADGIPANEVNLGLVRGKLKDPIVFVDGETFQPIDQAAPQKTAAATPAAPRKETIPKPAPAPVKEVVRQAAPAATKEPAPVWKVRGQMRLIHEFMTVTFPVTSVAVNGPVVMVFAPLSATNVLEPPRGTSFKVEFDASLLAGTPLADAPAGPISLFAPGVYIPSPDLRVRCSLFYIQNESV